jgi:uncharacterized Tic20 family protein
MQVNITLESVTILLMVWGLILLGLGEGDIGLLSFIVNFVLLLIDFHINNLAFFIYPKNSLHFLSEK